MTANTNYKASAETQHQLTELDEKRKMASEVLKRVDQLIKAKDLQKALLETSYAKKIDPQNVYAHALEEHIQSLLVNQLKNQRQNEQIKNQPVPAIQTKNECTAKIMHPLPVEGHQNLEKTNSTVAAPVPQTRHSTMPARDRISNEIQQQRLFASVVDSRRVRNNNTGNPAKRHPKVVMIDDDKDLLSVLSLSIESFGFEVIAVSTSDEAYVLLKKFTPDIILCDINLETSTMGGFTFFEKVQEIEHLKQVPFIFLSGLNDDVLIRTGKELGADDYLVKPIKEQNLLAALRGKIKRFEKLKGAPAAQYVPAPFPLSEVHS
jgi:CheY-like chemotaxis protein